jgi:hypothetical protein
MNCVELEALSIAYGDVPRWIANPNIPEGMIMESSDLTEQEKR